MVEEYKEVTRDQFYEKMRELDVHPFMRCYSKGTPYLPVGLAGKACDKWEVRE